MRGAHPSVLERLVATNLEQTVGYGQDAHTQQAERQILHACALEQGRVFFLVGGGERKPMPPL